MMLLWGLLFHLTIFKAILLIYYYAFELYVNAAKKPSSKNNNKKYSIIFSFASRLLSLNLYSLSLIN
jgi:hypothetical protein